MKIRSDTLLIRKKDQIFSEIDDEIVMLDVSRGEYYNFNSMGSIIWNILRESNSISSIILKLTEEYDVPMNICRSETESFIEELKSKNLIEIVYEDG